MVLPENQPSPIEDALQKRKMNLSLEPLAVHSLKEACISRLEGLILSGDWQPGERLPSERDLAGKLNISRPVLHEALVDLAAKGLVSIQPRRGVLVNDFRKTGSCAILSSLLTYHQGEFDPRFVKSLFEMRLLVETECARLAAVHATPEQLDILRQLIENQPIDENFDTEVLIEQDFEFHLQVAIASGNLMYPLVINSFKNVYIHFTGEFFNACRATPHLAEVFVYHRRLVQAIAARQPEEAVAVMVEMLAHGEKYFRGDATNGNVNA